MAPTVRARLSPPLPARIVPLAWSIVIACVTAAALAGPAGAGAGDPSPDRAPMALGVSLIEGNTPDRGDDLSALDAYAARAGRMPASFSIWSDWGGETAAFPTRELLDGLRDRGVRPVIFWQPTGPDWRDDPTRYGYAAVAGGAWDAYLTAWATDAAAWGERVVVRWAHEMNAPWFPWAIGSAGNTAAGHVAAWRHIVDLVRSIAPEVRFLWSPGKPCGRACVDYAELYPGDAWVDLAGFDAYEWDPAERASMVETYRPAMRAIRALSDRPVVVAETGAAGPSDGRGAWLADGLDAVFTTFPRIEGLLWFDIDMRFAGHPDWRLSDADGTIDAWAAAAADPRFAGILDPAPVVEAAAAATASPAGAATP